MHIVYQPRERPSDYIADNFLSSQYQKNASPERASIIQAMQIYAR